MKKIQTMFGKQFFEQKIYNFQPLCRETILQALDDFLDDNGLYYSNAALLLRLMLNLRRQKKGEKERYESLRSQVLAIQHSWIKAPTTFLPML